MNNSKVSTMINFSFQSILNRLLIGSNGISFGSNETVSSVIGKNQLNGSLSSLGNLVNLVLDFFDPGHAVKSIT